MDHRDRCSLSEDLCSSHTVRRRRQGLYTPLGSHRDLQLGRPLLCLELGARPHPQVGQALLQLSQLAVQILHTVTGSGVEGKGEGRAGGKGQLRL